MLWQILPKIMLHSFSYLPISSFQKLLTIDIWYTSARDISRSLLDYSHDAMKLGQVDVAMLSLRQSWRFKLFGGENLSMILQSSGDRIRLMVSRLIVFICIFFGLN